MILLKALELKGFYSYRDYNKVIIPNGITGIVGNIGGQFERSNGCGKSSLVNGILFALYGAGNYDKIDEIWNYSLDETEDAFVKVTFSVFDTEYIVERGRKKKSTYLNIFKNGELLNISVRDGQNFINSLFGVDESLFLVSVFFKQGDFNSFIEMEPRVRRTYIDSVLSIDLWKNASKIATTRLNKKVEERDFLIDEISNLSKLIERYTDELNIKNEKVAELPTIQKRISELESILDTINESIAKINQLRKLEVLLNDLTTERNRFTKEINDFDIKLEALNKKRIELSESSDNHATDTQIASINDEIKIIESETEKLLLEKDSLNTEISKIDQELSSTNASLIHYNNTLKQLREAQRIIESGKCDRCLRDFSDSEKEKYLVEINSSIQNIVHDIENLTHLAGTSLPEKKLGIRNKLSQVESLLSTNDYTVKEKRNLIDNIKTAEVKRAHSIESIEKEASYIENHRKILFDSIANTEARIKSVTDEIENLSSTVIRYEPSFIDQTRNELQILKDTERNLIIYQGEINKLNQLIESSNRDISVKKEALEALQYEIKCFEFLVNAFGEIPSQLFEESIGTIEKYSNDIIKSIFPGFSLKIYEDVDKKNRPVLISFIVDGHSRNYKLLSGGQKVICAIGLRLGLSRVVSEKVNTNFGFLILDEIFGFLDRYNRAEVLSVLFSLKRYFPQILVITHTEDEAVFENTITVSMDGDGISSIQ